MSGALLQSFSPQRPAGAGPSVNRQQGNVADYQGTMSSRNMRRSPRSNRDAGGRGMDQLKRILGIVNGSASGSNTNNNQPPPPPPPPHNPNAVSSFSPERFLAVERRGNNEDNFWVHPNASAIVQNADADNQPVFAGDRPRNAPFLYLHPSAAVGNAALQARLVEQMQAPPMRSGLTPTGSPVVLPGRDDGARIEPIRWPFNRFQLLNPSARGSVEGRDPAAERRRRRRQRGEGFRQRFRRGDGCVVS
ncbi:hypothetical protein PG993_000868 [Apiospora rasikravindrae]|uniref:Uncharacterized protein n=1 Tax=Apiospora rasikravindrae TaxID=990691 RepID=A0ABR1UBU6_9PEZI